MEEFRFPQQTSNSEVIYGRKGKGKGKDIIHALIGRSNSPLWGWIWLQTTPHVHQMELLGNTPIGRSMCVANVWDGPNSSLLVVFPPPPLTLTLTNIWLTIFIAKKIGG